MVLLQRSITLRPGFGEEHNKGPNPWLEQYFSSPPWPPSWPSSAPPVSASTRATSTACRNRASSTDPRSAKRGNPIAGNTALTLVAATKTLVGGRTALACGAAAAALGALALANHAASRRAAREAPRQAPVGGRAALARGAAAAALGALALANHAASRRAEREHPPEGKFIEVDGVRLHYTDRGAGQPRVPPPRTG